VRRGRKGGAELEYWEQRRRAEGTLGHEHYEEFYTRQFGLARADYAAGARHRLWTAWDSWREREPWTGGPGLLGARLTRVA
jgi:hypothetical protein